MLVRNMLGLLFGIVAAAQPSSPPFNGSLTRSVTLAAGEVVEISAGFPKPSLLPANGRVALEWAGMKKTLHAFDPDFYTVFRAPKAGTYTLTLKKLEGGPADFNQPRWRELGSVQKIERFPEAVPWPGSLSIPVRAEIRRVSAGQGTRHLVIEAEPNDSIAVAQPVAMGRSGEDESVHITGGADDIEYFDNGQAGKNGIDYFRIEFQGKEPRLFTANLALPDPFVVAQLLVFTADGKEYREGANANERVHQQLEGHRTALTRRFEPGGVYFLKVESNSPGYDVELRLRRPAPYTDPRQAIRQAMYDHLGQVDAWLLNRPRGAAVDRRIRDTGSLLGSHCMSCHTQSGVWGSAGPMAAGYRVENVHNLRHLMNLMYESLRPTNTLIDAANNTSLPPLDLGDGPAGTRVAGFNVTTIEGLVAPRRLHSAQQIRAANFVLQSADPSGINAAGPGSNVGQSIVYRFAAEILKRAWEQTGQEKYLAGMEEKAERILGVVPKYSDDLSNRIEFFRKTFPASYVAARENSDDAQNLWTRAQAQIAADERRLRAIQKPDGSWGFHPGVTTDNGWTWRNGSDDPKDADPAPTALALTALAALGYDDKDPQVKRGVAALLQMQDPYGRWNRNALTGFVTTSYSMHALARLYPENAPAPDLEAVLRARPNEVLADTVARFRALAQLGLRPDDVRFLDMAVDGARHASPMVRYWAQLGLGAFHDERGVTAQLAGLSDPVKMVREAARWGVRQTLLDDKGWDTIFARLDQMDDLAREALAGALVLRADATMTRTAAQWPRLTRALERMMNQDPHPAVRAWASRAAWNWWVWNPPSRKSLNQAFLTSLAQPEPSVLAEAAKRYQTEALFIVNGQRANGSREHQYPELAQLFEAIIGKLEKDASPLFRERLVKIASTYYSTAGGDGGPGQMGYVTAKSAEMMGKALLPYWQAAEERNDPDAIRLALEASANVTYDPLQKKVLHYSSAGPENLRTLASTSLADPRVISLPATQEFVEPLVDQMLRGAQEPERRAELVAPLTRLFARARWNIPKTEEQQRIFFGLIVPTFAPERGKLEENTRELAQMDKDPADWYVARAFGQVLHSNPDLQTKALLERFPKTFATPMEEMLWLPSVRWLETYNSPVPEVRAKAGAPDAATAAIRDRAVELYLKQIGEAKVDGRLRGAALTIAADPRVHNDPKIRPALKAAKSGYVEDDVPEVAKMPQAWRENFDYFKNWVAPELTKANREDEFSCLGCHGVAGRVPSMELAPADGNGYQNAKALWTNYRTLLERVNEADVERSKLLRKPLNVQSGKEDGHQGGRRFNPGDRGYEILRRWVLDAASLKQSRPLTSGGN